MIKSIPLAALTLICAVTQFATTVNANAMRDEVVNALAMSDRVKMETALSASSADPLASGKAKFESRDGRLRLSVQAEDVSSAGTLTVRIGGAFAGTISIDAFGSGCLDLDSKIDPVPGAGSGSTVEVSAPDGTVILSGTF